MIRPRKPADSFFPGRDRGFSQAERILVCKKLYTSDLDPAGFLDKTLDETYYPSKDYHKLFVAEIVKVWRRSKPGFCGYSCYKPGFS